MSTSSHLGIIWSYVTFIHVKLSYKLHIPDI